MHGGLRRLDHAIRLRTKSEKGVIGVLKKEETSIQFTIFISYICRRKFRRELLEVSSGIWDCSKGTYDRDKKFAISEMHSLMEWYGKREGYLPKEIKQLKVRVIDAKRNEPPETALEVKFRILDLKSKLEKYTYVKTYMRQ